MTTALLAACDSPPEPIANPASDSAPRPATELEPDEAPPEMRPSPTPPRVEPPAIIGAERVLTEWRKAENRGSCAPLAFANDGGQSGESRPATFSGGWGIAFDLPDLRSAYGIAGAGLIPSDDPPAVDQRRRLAEQWPYFRDLGRLPQPAFAGYGVVGAEPYPASNPSGRRLHSLAYVRVEGEACTYNVWSRISRAHLETLLDNLRLVRR